MRNPTQACNDQAFVCDGNVYTLWSKCKTQLNTLNSSAWSDATSSGVILRFQIEITALPAHSGNRVNTPFLAGVPAQKKKLYNPADMVEKQHYIKNLTCHPKFD